MPGTTKAGEALAMMNEKNLSSVPVAGPDGKVMAFVDLLDVTSLMLNLMREAFRIPTKDPNALQMRLNKMSGKAGEFWNTPVQTIVNLSSRNQWKPVRPGFSIFDVCNILATSVHRVPLLTWEGELVSIVSQSKIVSLLNDDPKNRLGRMGKMTAAELGGKKAVLGVKDTTMVMEAFEMLAKNRVGAIPVTDVDGKLCCDISSDTAKLVSSEFFKLVKPIKELREISGGDDSMPIYTCKLDETLEVMVARVAKHKARRLWVVDDESKPIGVISLTDLISAIIGRNDK